MLVVTALRGGRPLPSSYYLTADIAPPLHLFGWGVGGAGTMKSGDSVRSDEVSSRVPCFDVLVSPCSGTAGSNRGALSRPDVSMALPKARVPDDLPSRQPRCGSTSARCPPPNQPLPPSLTPLLPHPQSPTLPLRNPPLLLQYPPHPPTPQRIIPTPPPHPPTPLPIPPLTTILLIPPPPHNPPPRPPPPLRRASGSPPGSTPAIAREARHPRSPRRAW